MSEEQIFLNVLDLPDATARAAYLDEACGGDANLRAQVDKLVAAHFKSGEFMDVPAAAQIDSERIDGGSSASYAVTVQSVAMNTDQPADDESDSLEFLTPPTRPDSLGRIGHYEVLQLLGKGGFGIVLRAFDDVLQRVVAIKVMSPQMAATSPARKRFLREARSSAAVRHENVVQVYEVGEQPLPYLVMEFIPGETLQQRIDRMGPLDVAETVRIGRQIAEGLAAAHAMDLIHRDIKPGNVLLEGGQHKVKITDFGLARAADDASMTQSGMIAGTPMYMAPEQVLGQTLDQRADLFSLGSVLYQMVAGRPPFRANTTVAVLKRVAEDTPRNIREVIPETPQWLCDIIAKLHAKSPDNRYQSAREVADVLADCEAQLKQNSRLRDYSRIPRSGSAAASGKWIWAAVAAGVLLPLLALTYTELAGVTNWFRGRQPKVAVGPVSITNLGPTAADRANPQNAPTADGFVPLFNGNDLTGWKTHPEQPGHWEVKDGILIGSQVQGDLYSERGDFANFHLRVQAKVNLGGDSGIFFRTGSNVQPSSGYEAEIHKNRTYARKTGTITALQAGPPLILGLVADDSLTRPDEWFDLEIIAQQGRFITKINGQETANCNVPTNPHAAGHIGLQVWNPNTVVQFRKIEIKELPASPPVTEGFVSLFNGQELTGWKKHSLSGGDWKVEDGAIDGRGITSYLFTESGDYANFHLRVEAKINGNGDAGVYIRTPFDVGPLPISGPAKFALLGGYEAAIALCANYPTHTGSLTAANGSILQAGPLLPHKPDEWFVLEVIADDNRIRTLVDGQPAADYTDDKRRFSRGHIALQTWGPSITSVQFRRVEIKELPASTAPAVPPVPAVAPFDAAQAKNHQDSWAKHLSVPVEYTNSIGMKFRLIPPGEFLMGASEKEIERILDGVTLNWQITRMKAEGPQQAMTVREPYYLGQHEVTLGQFRQFVQETGYKTTAETNGKGGERHLVEPDRMVEVRPDYIWSNPIDSPTDDHPVVFVSLEDARQFCLWLSKTDGRTYALPRDDQWEFACRAGTTTRWFDQSDVPRIAWVRENSEGRLHPIGLKAANPFGLCDMHGNAAELCEPVPPKNAARRGGDSTSSVVSCRSASRWELGDSLPWYRNGFRVAIVGDLNRSALAPATLPAEKQVEEVRKQLMQLNPGFDGQVTHKIEDGVVTEFKVVTDQVTDIAPIRVFNSLRLLDLSGTATNYHGNSQLADLSPLKGMNLAGLTYLDLHWTQVGNAGLVHFQDCKNLWFLGLDSTQVTDAGLANFKDCTSLRYLSLSRTKVGDAGLAHFQDCKQLTHLRLGGTQVSDAGLAYFKDCKSLRSLYVNSTLVSNAGLAPFEGCKELTMLHLQSTRVSDAGLAHFKDCKELTRLHIGLTKIADLSLLKEMPLKELDCDFRPERDAEILRSIKTLETINGKPAAEFWKEFD